MVCDMRRSVLIVCAVVFLSFAASAGAGDASLSWRGDAPAFRVGRNRLELSVTNKLAEAHWYKVHVWIHGDGVRCISAGWHHVAAGAGVDFASEVDLKPDDRALELRIYRHRGTAVFETGPMPLGFPPAPSPLKEGGVTEFRLLRPTDKVFTESTLTGNAPLPEDHMFAVAGGEELFFQIVAVRTGLAPVSVDFLGASDDGGELSADSFRVRKVENVETTMAYWPDMLSENTAVTLEGRRNIQPYYCRARIPRGLKAGLRRLCYAFSVDGVRREVPVAVRVRPFDLPVRAPVKTAVGLQPTMCSRLLKRDRGYGLSEQLRLCDEFGIFPLAANVELPTEIEGIDYSLLPDWRELDDRYGMIHVGSLQTVSRMKWYFGRRDRAKNRYRSVEAYFDDMARVLAVNAAAVKAEGRLGDAFFYYDEIGYDSDPAQSAAFLRSVKANTGLKLGCAFSHPKGGRASLDYAADVVDTFYLSIDYLGPERTPEDAASIRQAIRELQAKGKEVWWYINPFPRYPSFNYIMQSGVKQRSHHVQLMREGLDGTLLWGMCFAGKGFGKDFDRWPYRLHAGCDGDGQLAYPENGRLVPSMRLALIRQSIDDAKYFALLKSRVAGAPKHPTAAKAREFLESNWQWLPEKVWGKMPEDEDYWRARDSMGDIIESFCVHDGRRQGKYETED